MYCGHPTKITVILTPLVVAAVQAQEQFGIQYIAQVHFDMQTRGAEPVTFRFQDAGATPEPQPPILR